MPNTTLTVDEWNTLLTTLLNGQAAAARLANYIARCMKITDESNRLYRDTLEVASECYLAHDFATALGFSMT